jgi:hypothetical protein
MRSGSGRGLVALALCAAAVGIPVWAAPAPAHAQEDRTPDGLFGTWDFRGEGFVLTLTLRPDGTGVIEAEPMRYRVRGDLIEIREEGEEPVQYRYRLSGDALTLSGGDLEQPGTFVRRGIVPPPPPPPAPAPRPGPGPDPAPPGGDDDGWGGGHVPRPGPVPPAPPTAPRGAAVGTWECPGQNGLVTLVLGGDGEGSVNGVPFRWKLERGVLEVSANGRTITYQAVLGDGTLALSGGDLAQPATFRRAGEARPGNPGGPTAAAAGLWVAEEASLDPQFYMRYTQYVVLYPDGTVQYAKAEGGASRTEVTAYLERFRSWRSGVQPAGGEAGRFETDGRRIVVHWRLFGGRDSAGEIDPASGRMVLQGMGVLEEGKALEFRREQ